MMFEGLGVTISRRTLAAFLLLPVAVRAQARSKVRIGQATPAISILPIMAARALGSFAAQGLDLKWASIPGGDPTALAALGSGDLDLAAVGSETVLAAIARGLPFQIVASMMSKVSLELVVSTAFLKRTGVALGDPLPARLAALQGAVIGVSAIGGTQDRAARWLALQAGFDPRTGVQVANVGAPPALQAALENARIDAFVLSPPEGLIAEDAGTGRVLVRLGEEFPQLRGVPSLVLVAKTPIAPVQAALTIAALRALRVASQQVVADPAGSAEVIQRVLLPRAKPAIIAAAVDRLQGGLAGDGRLDPAGMAALLRFVAEAGGDTDKRLDAATGEGRFWTNEYADAAAR